MSYFESLEKALSYIESHLQDDIDLDSIAKEAGYTLYHFHRIFKAIIGDSVKDYIRKRRITEAAKELTNTNQAIVDIAIKYGYQSREAFSRTFKKVYGKNPSTVKKEGLLYFIREPMTHDYLMFEYNRKKEGIEPILEKLPERYVIGKRSTIRLDGSNLKNIPLLWHQWHQDKEWEKIKARISDNKCMGVCIPAEGAYMDYMLAHEVKEWVQVPDDMASYKLEASLYAGFKTIGPITETVQKTWDYIYSVWLNEVDYEHAGTADIENYYYDQGVLVAKLYVPLKEN